MELKFWMQFIGYLLVTLLILFVAFLCMSMNEKKGKLAASFVGISGFLVVVVIIAFIDGANVITLKDKHYETNKWIIRFKDGDKSFPIEHGKTYIYNADEDTCNLILYPVYYSEDTKIIGTPVNNPVKAEDIIIHPGQLMEFKRMPQYLFKSPRSFEVSSQSKELYWYLDYKENVDTATPIYKRLRVEYNYHVDYD